MPTPKEFDREFTLTLGFVVAIISATFVLTREYMLIHQLQDRIEYINDRATRLHEQHQQEIDDLKQWHTP